VLGSNDESPPPAALTGHRHRQGLSKIHKPNDPGEWHFRSSEIKGPRKSPGFVAEYVTVARACLQQAFVKKNKLRN
jgi:hypothetical protein